MNGRNKFVQDGLQQAYAQKVSEGRLQTFCVANRFYWKYVEKGNRAAIRASGIPALRRHCHTVTAHARYMEAKNFLLASLPSLLNSLRIWAGRATDLPAASRQHRQQLLSHVAGLPGAIKLAIRTFKQSVLASFDEQINNTAAHRVQHWEAAADHEHRKWKGWHAGSYAAFVRHNGNHSTAAAGSHRWNKDLIWKMRSELEPAWSLFVDDEIPEAFSTLRNTLLQRIRGVSPNEADLADSVQLHVASLEYQLNGVERDFLHRVNTLRCLASEDTSESFVFRTMLPVYRRAAAEHGSGMSERQKCIMDRGVGPDSLFPNMAVHIADRMHALVARVRKSVQTHAEATIEELRKDFEMALAEVPENDASEKARRKIRGKVRRWDDALEKFKSDVLASEE